MIQRIQSVWLAFAAAASFAAIKFSFYSGTKADNTFAELNGQSHFLLLILGVATALTALFALFLFKNRKLQMQLSLLGLLLQVGILAFYFSRISDFTNGNFALTSLLSFAIPVFFLLAWLGIRKDEKLIKSMDRLR
ncbi:DUF4293 family protein [Lacibacter sp. MH-610]|uniref:DUF4293 family protein n=1 Tax=Lacibacter sp. MH-610 TaxID=3020883 RepID=UPI00389248EC